MVCTDQKSAGCMLVLANKISKPGGLKVDLFFGTFATAKKC